MKGRNKIFRNVFSGMLLFLIGLSGCEQDVSVKEEVKKNLRIEVQNEVENLQWIQVQVGDFEKEETWLDVGVIREDQGRVVLESGKVYKQELAIDESRVEDVDTFKLEISYQEKGKNSEVCNDFSVSKDEWQDGKIKKFIIREQVVASKNGMMPDLELEVLNQVEDATSIYIEASTKEKGNSYFTAVEIREDYNDPEALLRVGKTYKQKILGETIEAREKEIFYLRVNYVKTSGEVVEIGTFPISKDDCWNEQVQRIVVEKRAVVVSAEE